MPEFRGEAILEALRRHGVDVIVIGGFAARIYGSPMLTSDIDVVPNRAADNLARLSAALTELDAKVRAAEVDEPLPFAHDATSLAAARVWNLTTRYGDLDLTFEPAGTRGYDDLRRDAIDVVVRGTSFSLASLADVVRSKEAAGRDKDRRALPVLRELLARQQRDRRTTPR